jgi:hypothetical protein
LRVAAGRFRPVKAGKIANGRPVGSQLRTEFDVLELRRARTLRAGDALGKRP